MLKHLLAAVLLLTGAAALAFDAPPPPKLPERAIGVIEAPSLRALQDHLQEFVSAVAPDQKNVGGALGMALMGVTKCNNAGLIEFEKPLRIYLLKGAPGKITHVAVFAVKGPSAYRSSLVGTLRKDEEKDGITAFKERSRDLFMGEAETAMVLGNDRDAVQRFVGLLNDGKMDMQPYLSGGDLCAFINVKALLAQLTTPEGGPFKKWRDAVKTMAAAQREAGDKAAPGKDQPGPAKLSVILNAEIDAVESLAGQIDTAWARWSAGAQAQRLSFGFTPSPGSSLAAYLASVPQAAPETSAYLPDDAAIAFAIKVGDMKAVRGWFSNFMQAIATPNNPGVAVMNDLMSKSIAATGDDGAFSVALGDSIRVMQVMRAKSPEAALEYTQDRAKAAAAAGDIYKGTGIELMTETPPPVAYNGHTIWPQILKMSINAIPGGDAEDAAAANLMVGNILGEVGNMNITVMDRDMLCVGGKDSLAVVHAIIDGKQRRLTDDTAFKQAAAAAPAGTQGFLFVRVTDIISFGMRFAKMTAEQQDRKKDAPAARIQIPQPKFKRGPGVFAAFSAGASGFACDLNVPAAEVKAIVEGFKPPPPPAAAPKAPPAPPPAK